MALKTFQIPAEYGIENVKGKTHPVIDENVRT